jgi:hypothetical protein
MSIVARSCLASAFVILAAPVAAQTPEGISRAGTVKSGSLAPPAAPRFVLNVAASPAPWREAGVASELRVSRFVTIGAAAAAGALGDPFDDRKDGNSRSFEGRVTFYPQGHALEGWQVTAGVGRQRLGGATACTTLVPDPGFGTRCFAVEETRTTAALMAGHQWLLGNSGRWTAGAVAGLRTSLGEIWIPQWRYNRVQEVFSLRF